jgi:hypothetical protein
LYVKLAKKLSLNPLEGDRVRAVQNIGFRPSVDDFEQYFWNELSCELLRIPWWHILKMNIVFGSPARSARVHL